MHLFLSAAEGTAAIWQHGRCINFAGLPVFWGTGCGGIARTPRYCVLACAKTFCSRTVTGDSAQSRCVTNRGTFPPQCRDNPRCLFTIAGDFLYSEWHDAVGVCDLHWHLSDDCRRFNPDAGGTRSADPRYRLSDSAIYDNFAVRHAAFTGRQSDDAFADELAEWGELRLLSDAPDAGST